MHHNFLVLGLALPSRAKLHRSSFCDIFTPLRSEKYISLGSNLCRTLFSPIFLLLHFRKVRLTRLSTYSRETYFTGPSSSLRIISSCFPSSLSRNSMTHLASIFVTALPVIFSNGSALGKYGFLSSCCQDRLVLSYFLSDLPRGNLTDPA